MKVLAISGPHRDAAAALAANGRVVAAASESSFARIDGIGYQQTGGFPFGAATACLDRTGADVDDTTIVVVRKHGAPNGHGRGATSLRFGAAAAGRASQYAAFASTIEKRQVCQVSALRAYAAQAAAAGAPTEALILALDAEPPADAAAFAKRNGDLVELESIRGFGRLTEVTQRFGALLGSREGSPYGPLEMTAAGGEPEWLDAVARAVRWDAEGSIVVDQAAVDAVVRCATNDGAIALNDPTAQNVRIQERRRNLAASVHAHIAGLVVQLAERLAARHRLDRIVLSGSLFAHSRLNTLIADRLDGGVEVAPVPEPAGLALGGALAAATVGSDPIRALTLGPQFSEWDVKQTLENCRLEYLYEPSWERLLARVSAMLAQGKLIGWFQGGADFGPRSLGSRSILADPSSRYARENVNKYLKHRAVDHPVPLTLCEEDCESLLESPARSPFMLLRARVKPAHRDKVRAALDHDGSAPVHTLPSIQAPELWKLLQVHRARTAVPALINVVLSGPGEPMACTPRDAVRTTFSSAVDALVIQRFLVAKDSSLLPATVVA